MASVHVKIDDDQSNFFEEGEAVRTKGVSWAFITTSQVPQTPAPHVTAVAKVMHSSTEGLVWHNNEHTKQRFSPKSAQNSNPPCPDCP